MSGRVDPRRHEGEVGGDVPVRYVSLFSGIEAATVAWEPLGWEPMAFCEIEPFPCAVLEERFPSVPNMGDVSKVDWGGFVEDYGRPDVVVGGSPCQSFSVAGKREGLEGASGLMWEYVRAVAELRPRWIVWENVPGALSSADGEDFRCLIASMDELGYRMAWRVLDAQFFGVAQRRRRVFLVGDIGAAGGGAAEVLLEPEGLCGDTRSSREKRNAVAGASGERSGSCFALQSDGGTSLGSNGSGWSGDGSAYTLNTVDRQSVAVIPFDTTQITSPSNGDNPQFGDPNSTLAASKHPPAIAFKQGAGSKAGSVGASSEVAPTLTASESGTQLAPAACVADDSAPNGYVVRRLTPRECERLQGFPDNWSLVPYRGKSAEECPDGPRYKALGNSMCVNVMRWIGRRIEAVDAR